jgi:outer membrane immunogenic protein
LGVTVLATLAVTPALAADVVVYEEPPIIVADTFTWTGFYVGINAGFGGGRFDHPFDVYIFNPEGPESEDIANGSLDITSSGFLAGVQAGYNHQINNLILGVEADIQWADIEGELSGDINFGGPGGGLDFELGTQVEWFGTLRARLGYAATERLMVYATGGAAYGRVESYYDINFSGGMGPGGSLSDSISDTNWGWTIGGGFEYAVNDRWSLKTEYLYTDLGESDLLDEEFIFGGEVPIGVGIGIDSDVKFHTVRAGLNYRF